MKISRLMIVAFVAIALSVVSPTTASADSYTKTQSDNPFRLLAYPVHAVGTALEWGVTRPIHWLVSRPHARIIFGHEVNPDDVYFEWEDYE